MYLLLQAQFFNLFNCIGLINYTCSLHLIYIINNDAIRLRRSAHQKGTKSNKQKLSRVLLQTAFAIKAFKYHVMYEFLHILSRSIFHLQCVRIEIIPVFVP